MSKIKKLIALTLALAMVLSVSAFAGYKVDTYADASAIDADCKSAVELMYALEIMKGNENGEFMPTKSITRAEMAKIIYVILNYGNDDKAVTYTGGKFFTDVEAGYWAEGYINYCASTNLIAGRGNGTFDPTAAVTTAEAAKMLLTAIGYSAEARGYTGANWDKNVLADAAILGLLDGYKSNVNQVAPRQWVAVLIENALGCLTYTTMAPNFSGLLTSGSDLGLDTMGAKYYSLASFSSVAVATEDAYITGDELAGDGVLFANGLEIEGTGLKAADLGQKYKVIYNADEMEAYSVRSLGKVDTIRLYEAEYDIKHATSSNQPNNKYVFTFGDVKGTLQSGVVKYLTTEGDNGSLDAYDLRTIIDEAAKSPMSFKAIDSEADGDIDYLFVTMYDYGYVTEVATSEKYGKYINIAKLSTEEGTAELVEFNGGENLYLKDCIITADDIKEENIVKLSKDIDSGKIVVEVLPQVKGVEYKEYDDEDMLFVLGKAEYYVATTESGYNYETENLAVLTDDDNLGEKFNVVYDGDLIVYIWADDDSYDSLDKVNEQLVLLIDANEQYSNNTIREYEAIEYMTIDGKTHIAKYDMDELMEDGTTAIPFEWLERTADNGDAEDRLFKLKAGTKGRVYLEKLDEDNINSQLKVKQAVLNGYEEDSYYVDATGTSVKFLVDYVAATEETKATYSATYKVAGENKYFVGSYDKNGEFQATVMSLAELKNCYDADAYAQILTYTNATGTRTTVVGGYVFLDLDSDIATDYLYIEKIGRINGDGRKCDVVFADGTKKPITINEETSDTLVKNVLYAYSYNFMDDEYTVTAVQLGEQVDEIVEFDDENKLWTTQDDVELKKETIAIVTIKVDRDRDIADDDAPEFKLVVNGIKFVALKDLTTAMIENGDDSKTYTQYTDYELIADKLFYVANFQIMDTAQEIYDELPSMLEEIFASVLAGEETIIVEEVEEEPAEPEYPTVDEIETNAATVIGDVIYITADTDATAAEKAEAIEAALLAAGYTDIEGLANTGNGYEGAIKAKKGSITYTFTVASDLIVMNGAVGSPLFGLQIYSTHVYFEAICNLPTNLAANDVSVVLLTAEGPIAEAVRVKEVAAGNGVTIAGSFYVDTTYDSSSWDGNYVEDTSVVTGAQLYFNGVLIAECAK